MAAVRGCFCSLLPGNPGIRQARRTAKKILIVDDEYLIRHSLQKVIQREGYEVFTAESGRECLRLVADRKPHIVILDIRLPDTNGFALLKTIRRNSPGTVVIMATASPDPAGSRKARHMGALDYLEKPFDIGALKHLLQRAGWREARMTSDNSQIISITKIVMPAAGANKKSTCAGIIATGVFKQRVQIRIQRRR